jgi:uncharacterized protein YraI
LRGKQANFSHTGEGVTYFIFLALAIIGSLYFLFHRTPASAERPAAAVQTVQAGTVTVISDALNLRARASGSADIVRTLKKGDVLTVTGTADNGWLPVSFENTSGFVSEQYVQSTEGNRERQTQTTQPAAAPVTQPLPVGVIKDRYEIGDTGPAGGIIFYAKHNKSDGWQYLEAAPWDFGQLMVAATEDIPIENIKGYAVGSGKTNTAAIMAEAVRHGGGFGWAAQACDAYELNGFDDWYLPSRDELSYMYGNLHSRGLGNFRGEWYWTSTVYENSWNFNFWGVNFADGAQQSATASSNSIRVRAIRQF